MLVVQTDFGGIIFKRSHAHSTAVGGFYFIILYYKRYPSLERRELQALLSLASRRRHRGGEGGVGYFTCNKLFAWRIVQSCHRVRIY